jgi:hypothetical protein
LKTEICTGAEVCASWGVCVGVGVRIGTSTWGVQVEVFKFVRSSWGVQVGAFCEFLVSILRWSKPPHHVKVFHSGRWSKAGLTKS